MGLKHVARQFRKDLTDEEKQLWRALRSRRFAGFKFRRQHVVDEYVLDFYCPDAKLAVELDGFHHGLPAGLQNWRRFLFGSSRQRRNTWVTDVDIVTILKRDSVACSAYGTVER